ncbi:hypothetical protein BGW38_000233 [Lunasporangiospora selenospora]|uniref:Rhodanese domain-containing protein n=1 Tax=Lunasporangiospora selenospora TaxID=979761 RepID=A0A9P6KIK1_9FUNG|nr:hypothetical protein BGW38_000233 [Lunasporangiospora selenospora]
MEVALNGSQSNCTLNRLLSSGTNKSNTPAGLDKLFYGPRRSYLPSVVLKPGPSLSQGLRWHHTHQTLAVESSLKSRPLIPYVPPGPPLPGQLYQTLTFYTVIPIPEDGLEDLREEIFLQLVPFEITGRIYLAKDGINLHLCAPVDHVQAMQSVLEKLVLDRYGRGPDGAIWNYSCGEPGERVFRKLKVAVKKQLVADGRHGTWSVQDADIPQYLEPKEFHKRLDEVGDSALLVDMRNHFENEVGTFKTAVKMDCTTFKQNMDLLDELLEGRDKEKEVLMVCTGGIRCSVSGRYLRQKGFKDLKGGITSYGRYIKANPEAKSHFVGKNFTFDGRRGERITDDVISHCHQCNSPHDHLTNCANTRCHTLFIQCPTCRQKWHNTCGPECQEAVTVGTGSAVSKPYDYHAQVRPGNLLTKEISRAA